MKALQVAWGLLFDDTRLAVTLMVSLLVAGVAHYAGHQAWVAGLLVMGLFTALWVSVEHQLKLKLPKE